MARVNSHAALNPVILGAGPAGLTAAYMLSKHGIRSVILEKSNMVGGHARTEVHDGYRFDIGGHRFFSKIEVVNDIWNEVLGEEFLKVPRLSRIYYNDKYFDYPLKLINVLKGLGPLNSFLILMSYLYAQVRPFPREDNLEEWVSNRFGRKLFRTFFKTYTEKVWGIPCTEIRAEWVAQRITNLTFFVALKNAIFKPKTTVAKTLIDKFDYPRYGPGMMWESMRDKLHDQGSNVMHDAQVVRIERTGNHIDQVIIQRDGQEEAIGGSHFLSTMPIKQFVLGLDPAPPPEIVEAIGKFKYRDFLTVCLIVNKKDLFPDNWIYIHSPKAKVGRIQNFKNWSEAMVPDLSKTSLGMEYFCNAGDELWNMADSDLIELAKEDLEIVGMAEAADIEGGLVIRQSHAYPVYDADYNSSRDAVHEYLSSFDNLYPAARNGLHRYDNQDHAMFSAILAVENMLGGDHDVWTINTEKEYHEVVIESKERVPANATPGSPC